MRNRRRRVVIIDGILVYSIFRIISHRVINRNSLCLELRRKSKWSITICKKYRITISRFAR